MQLEMKLESLKNKKLSSQLMLKIRGGEKDKEKQTLKSPVISNTVPSSSTCTDVKEVTCDDGGTVVSICTETICK
jgi:hypothetical protein